MKSRVHRTLGALTLLGLWVFVPVGSMLGSSNALAWFLTALGLLAGTSAGWMVQHMLHRPMTRQMLTGAGWAIGVLLFVGLFRNAIFGSSALAHLALIIAYSGSLAWGVRLLLAPVKDHTLAHEDSRNLLVGIRNISHAGDEVAPRHAGHRTTPISPLLHDSAKTGPATAISRSRGQKTG